LSHREDRERRRRNLLPTAATDYRPIGLAPVELPLVTAPALAVNLYETDLQP
jgi:hypothetical protein